MKTTEVGIPCPECGKFLARNQELRENGVVIDLYLCGTENCGRKAVIIYEPQGGYTGDQQDFIKQEIARRGAFFPHDYTGSRR